jgi:hypothetical protein
MKSCIKTGDLVLFNPHRKYFKCKQEILLGKDGATALVIASVQSNATYLLSFSTDERALVDISLIEKVWDDLSDHCAESWFEAHDTI